MRLYPKKLNGIDELMAEKLILEAQIGMIDPDGIFSLKVNQKAKVADAVTEKKSTVNMLGGLLGLDSIDLILKMLPLITGGKKTAAVKKGPNILVKAGFEFIGGYLKWKAIELSYKGIKKLISTRKKND
ncbi:MAG: hypothetical protein P4L41_08950 [Flavipsychrobacter sp.]|nr:hypothetical protein [Flavipsychrobacter sp.]